MEQEASRWPEAARAYRRAWDHQPDNTVGYRLRRALVFAGRTAEAERFDRLVLDYREAYKQTRGLLDRPMPRLREGRIPAAELLSRMAELRERMGRSDEARAWRLLVSPGGGGYSAGESVDQAFQPDVRSCQAGKPTFLAMSSVVGRGPARRRPSRSRPRR